jgi:hypothetical protein
MSLSNENDLKQIGETEGYLFPQDTFKLSHCELVSFFVLALGTPSRCWNLSRLQTQESDGFLLYLTIKSCTGAHWFCRHRLYLCK